MNIENELDDDLGWKRELVLWQEEEDQQIRNLYASDNKILRKLKRRLKPKLYNAILWEMGQHLTSYLEIVDVSEVDGKKTKYSHFSGFSAPIRYVYDNTSYCSYSESYGGDVYLSLGSGKYLKMHISG